MNTLNARVKESKLRRCTGFENAEARVHVASFCNAGRYSMFCSMAAIVGFAADAAVLEPQLAVRLVCVRGAVYLVDANTELRVLVCPSLGPGHTQASVYNGGHNHIY